MCKKILLILMVLFLSGCSSVQTYTPTFTDPLEARLVIEELLLSQHKKWRPDYIDLNDRYLLLGFGSRSYTTGSAIAVGNIALADSYTTTRDVGDRIFFKRVNQVEIKSWIRWFSRWYVVSAFEKDHDFIKHMLYVREIEEAQQFVDAFETLRHSYK